MTSSDVDNQRYLNLSQMVLLVGSSKNKVIHEKHKFMTLLFFLREPLFLERLVKIYKPKLVLDLDIKQFEKYNLLYEEKRISLISPEYNLLISFLQSRRILDTDFTNEGFMFKLTDDLGNKLFKEIKNQSEFKKTYKRAKILNKILGSKKFEDIKKILIENFKELSI